MAGGNDDWKEMVERRLETHDTKIEALQAFRNWIVGGAAVVAYLLGLTSEAIKHVLGLK